MKTNLLTRLLLVHIMLLSAAPAIQARMHEAGTMRHNAPKPIKLPDAKNVAGGRLSASACFIENAGQLTDQLGKPRTDIGFSMKHGGLAVFIGAGGIHYQWAGPENALYRMDVMLEGANRRAGVVAEDRQSYFERYYLPGQEHPVVANAFRKITYRDVYPHIDWVIYIAPVAGNPGAAEVEYDFVIRPGGRVSDIRLKYNGAGSLSINKDGSLTAVTPMGSVTEKAPFSFQADGRKVSSRFVLKGDVLGFATGSYTGTLTIDPVLSWCTYYGGYMGELGYATTTDRWGNVYFSGQTNSTSNIVSSGNVYQPVHGGASDVFLVKFDSLGVRKWATYYGGSSAEEGWSLVCDEAGNLYMTGITQSPDFSVTGNAHQSAPGGITDAFIAKFDSSGARVWASYYGGALNDRGRSVTYDGAGYIYLAGWTESVSGIATPGSYQDQKTPFAGIMNDEGYLVKFDTSGKRIWGTYYGGDRTEQPSGVVSDKAGYIYMAGLTESDTGIATQGSHQAGMLGYRNGFLVKFDSAGRRIWGTYYGGDEATAIQGLSLDMTGSVYIAGTTNSNNTANEIATPGAWKTAPGMGPKGPVEDGFLARFDTSGKRFWGTYYGGTGEEADGITDVACDGFGDVFIVGNTESDHNIATSGSYQDTMTPGTTNVFLVKFDSTGGRLWGTYFGGSESAVTLTCDGYGSVYIGGFSSGGYPITTPNGFQPVHGGTWTLDAFLVRFAEQCPRLLPTAINGNTAICPGSAQTYRLAPVAGASSYTWALPPGWTGSSTGDSINVVAGATGGTISVTVNGGCGGSSTVTLPVSVHTLPGVSITVNGYVLGTSYAFTTYQWYKNGLSEPGATNPQYTVTANGMYSVKVTDSNGCADSSTGYTVTNVAVPMAKQDTEQVSVYPNPANDVVYIRSAQPVHIILSSMDGRTILRREQAEELDLHSVPEGMYLIRATDTEGRLIHTERLTKIGR